MATTADQKRSTSGTYSMTSSSTSNNKKSKSLKRPRLIKGVSDEDWTAFRTILNEHNETVKKPVSMRTFFKLMNTYSPLIKSLLTLDPDNSPIQQLGVNTAMTHVPMWVKNIGNNIARIKKEHDIREFRGSMKGKAAIIIGAGESLTNNASGTDYLQLIKDNAEDFDGIIILADRVLGRCLALGIGDYFTVVDGSDKILPFFENEEVKTLNLSRIEQQILLPENRKINKMKAIMATCAHPSVVNAWNGEIYFLVASIPNEILPNTTRFMCDITETSDINAGGNCGMLAWNVAMWMGCSSVALVGMDYSYNINTPLDQTGSNWTMFMRLGDPEKAKECYHVEHNPFFNNDYRIDDIYLSFKQVALNWMTAYSNHGQETINCSEGGGIWGEMNGTSIKQMYLKDYLLLHKKPKQG